MNIVNRESGFREQPLKENRYIDVVVLHRASTAEPMFAMMQRGSFSMILGQTSMAYPYVGPNTAIWNRLMTSMRNNPTLYGIKPDLFAAILNQSLITTRYIEQKMLATNSIDEELYARQIFLLNQTFFEDAANDAVDLRLYVDAVRRMNISLTTLRCYNKVYRG